jgi:hypothetical protein
MEPRASDVQATGTLPLAGDEAVAAPPARRRPAPRRREPRISQTQMIILLGVLTILVISAGGWAVSLASNKRSPSNPPPASPNTPVPVTHFNDPDTGASLDYPRTWRKVEVPNATYRLVLDAGNNVAMTLRVFTTEVETNAANLANIKAVTDGIVTSNSTVNILKQQAIQLNDMVGYYYFYTFNDNNGLPAVHAHYFLFQGRKMNMIVFQSSVDDFEKNAATFDKIAESFHSDPRVAATAAPAANPSTTAAPTTSVP